MSKQGRYIVPAIIMACGLSGCIGTIWTGASVIYDRHDTYKKLDDYHLLVEVNNVLAVDRTFNNKNCAIDIAVFNGDILLAGHVPSVELLDELSRRLRSVNGYRRLFNEITVNSIASNKIQDVWITTKIRSQILADSTIDPDAFKIVTSDRIVYLMGDVKRDEAEKVIKIARFTRGVEHVVKILRYFTYQP
ncbi:hemolysin [Legionella antarctica]|uniref:Hemolysin n=1 Tax=Legionella antarctica TaxID=2708020 RepID=A0A6F8T908_9GAMM|nr:BON domain-containing protein [Legionella antarctica]BCA97165.1 hemolysin [Legionella antarctica]